jgi:uncharacterized protein HemY
MLRRLVHSSQKMSPHSRQWCRRMKKSKGITQLLQAGA